MQGPNWGTTAVFVFWDEWGGFYDHVPPPQVDILGYGVRMPLLVISPWTRWGESSDGGYISHTFYSHASYLALVGTNWSLPPITPRVGSANDMMDMFDFAQSPKPPIIRGERPCAPLSPQVQAIVEAQDPD
jgi:phospholipase C